MTKIKKGKPPHKPKVDNSRKALRKQKRLQKKQHKQEHYMKKKTVSEQPKYSPGRFVKRPVDGAGAKVEAKKKKTKHQPSAQELLKREREKEIKAENELKSQMEEQRRKVFMEANESEDKLIKKLEKQLGLNKSKNKNNYFADDGLDYLLEICDRSTTEQIVAAEKHLAEVEADSDFEEDLAVVTGKDKDKLKTTRKKQSNNNDNQSNNDNQVEADSENEFDDQSEEDNQNGEDFGDDGEEVGDELGTDDELASDEEMDGFDSDISEGPEKIPINTKKSKVNKETKSKTKEKIIKEDEISKVFSDDEVSHLSDDGDEFDDGDEDNDNESQQVTEKPDVWEDIYGRKRDKQGNVIKEEKGVYIPPHLRNKDSNDSKQMEQLKRQIKSVLNKLAGTNLHWACNSIESLYSNNSRNSVNSAITQLWLEATVGPSHTPDRMVAEHAALVSVLHANVGSEIGAHFLQDLCKKFDAIMQNVQPIEDKHLDNLVSCLAHLYSFKIYHATLFYDILSRLVEQLSEKSIECVVVGLRCVGGVLRKEEPAQLRDFIHDTQEKVTKVQGSDGSRIKFLLEVLMAVKNNNLTKIPNYDPSYQEHLKKITKGVIRRGNYVTPLNIRLEDLLKAEERGKWWVVGSAWEGSTVRDVTSTSVAHAHKYDTKLLELAKQQRMNTDVRRSIFCVIMAAEDYMDAFEKLQHLGLKSQQEREVVHVLLACCLQEKNYNPYYGVLAQKLCEVDRKYQLSIQFSVWDKIKDIENQSKQYLKNLAQFLIHLIMEKALPLSVLKVIQFSELNKQSVRFMRQILLSIIMNNDLQSSLEVFQRISKPPKLHMFRESLKLFIQHFLLKNAGKGSNVLSDSEMETLKQRAVEVNKILTMYESKLQF